MLTTTTPLLTLPTLSALPTHSKLEVLVPARVTGYDFSGTSTEANTPSGPVGVSLQVDGQEPETFASRLVLAADGGKSPARQAAGISTWGWGYGQKAVVVTVKLEGGHGSTAWQRFMETGPLAVLPLWDNYASIVWSNESLEAQRLAQLPEEEFLRELNDALTRPGRTVKGEEGALESGPLGAVVSALYNVSPLRHVDSIIATASRAAQLTGDEPFHAPPRVSEVTSRRFAIDLSLSQSKHYHRPRVALVGDAAHTIHPMAGQVR